MKAVDTVLYEITPEELEKVSSGVQVLRYDVLSGSYYVFEMPNKPKLTKLHEKYVHYFLFDRDEAFLAFERALR